MLPNTRKRPCRPQKTPLPQRAQAQPCVDLELPLGAAPFDLEATVCNHGLFMLAPSRWDPASHALLRPLRVPARPRLHLPCVPLQHPPRLRPRRRRPLPARQGCILEQVRRMLRLSKEDGRAVEEFQAMHAAAREAGFRSVFQSLTLFKDMVKCILLCNCQFWRHITKLKKRKGCIFLTISSHSILTLTVHKMPELSATPVLLTMVRLRE